MGRLHCTQDPVPEAVGGDMQQLNQLGAQQFSALTEVLFHFLTEPKEVERFLAQLSEFATTNQISLGPLRSIVKSLLLVPNGALKKGLTAEQVRADFMTLGLSEEKAVYFSEKWKQNAPTLARWAIGQTLMINQLVDMEWKFGVTSGSSELEKVGSIFLQLKLVVKKGNQTENVYIDGVQTPEALFLVRDLGPRWLGKAHEQHLDRNPSKQSAGPTDLPGTTCQKAVDRSHQFLEIELFFSLSTRGPGHLLCTGPPPGWVAVLAFTCPKGLEADRELTLQLDADLGLLPTGPVQSALLSSSWGRCEDRVTAGTGESLTQQVLLSWSSCGVIDDKGTVAMSGLH
ncbi:hypothetical protein MJG53_011929 [Ovis ammon polii x Ovis aries]|uniref:Uncharacterized protein n=1 Tax=Ovis ammon polii x Ovis aries TaxID=2918886 RepID=A0ACB9UQ33_9CETA|nr:hypothetical protein MJG53_011929 [Ovis ammon polii x Ovis aries]